MGIVLFLAGIVLGLILMSVTLYYRLVKLRNNSEQAFADVDVQLRLRHDLIPQLIDSIKGAMLEPGEQRAAASEPPKISF